MTLFHMIKEKYILNIPKIFILGIVVLKVSVHKRVCRENVLRSKRTVKFSFIFTTQEVGIFTA